MVTKRPSSGPQYGMTPNTSAQLKYRPLTEIGRSTKGTKLLPSPVTIPEIMTKVLVHFCKRVLYVDPKIRVMAYAVLLFLVSLVADYLPFPKSYFSNTNNIPNQFFVKFSWGWTFVGVGMYILLTASVYCCGDKKQIGRHLVRLIIATGIWFVWTNLFATIEEATGKCIYTSPGSPTEVLFSKGRRTCLKNGGKWTSFDISGHSFLLIWCVFFIIEESKPIIGWDLINDHIRDEEHKRALPAEDSQETPLSGLTTEEFKTVKTLYSKFGIWAKVCLILLTGLVLIWDLMLFATACYFHIMIEKVFGGLIALGMWRATYNWFYKMNVSLSPGMPGTGNFKYSNLHFGSPSKVTMSSSQASKKPRSKETEDLPKFMGMPLYALRGKQKEPTDALRNLIVPSK